jgi:uncharacterized protein
MRKAVFFGPNAPFVGGSQGFMSRQEDERLVKNDLLQLLRTSPGEREMRPNFGVDLYGLVFEQADSPLIMLKEQEIRSAVAKYEPRVTLTGVNIVIDEDRHAVSIRVTAVLKIDPSKQLSVDVLLSE